MSVGGHQMTRAEKLSLPQLYNQYLYTAYYIRAGLPREEVSFILCPLSPPTRRGLRGTFRPKKHLTEECGQTRWFNSVMTKVTAP